MLVEYREDVLILSESSVLSRRNLYMEEYLYKDTRVSIACKSSCVFAFRSCIIYNRSRDDERARRFIKKQAEVPPRPLISIVYARRHYLNRN